MTTKAPTEVILPLVLRGGNLELYNAREPEVLAEGPAGTGKTRTALELLNDLCHYYPGLRILMVRKVQASMALSCISEYRLRVLHRGDGVSAFGGSGTEPEGFRYRNGSFIATVGMDKPDKILSSFFDIIYVNEATELTQEDWEILTTRLRGSGDDHPIIGRNGERFSHRRMIADCNPTYATHWLMRRTDEGICRLIRSKLQDNPAYYDMDGNLTEDGEGYVRALDGLHGILYQRMRLGLRVGVENAIYEQFSRITHVRPLEPGLHFEQTIIGVDYGTDHLCAVVAVSIDQYRRRWVREAWAEADTDEGVTLTRIIGQFKERYHTNRGRVDPNQAYLAGRTGFSTARGGSGGMGGPPRLHRIDLMEPLFYEYEGGRVPSFSEEIRLVVPTGPFAEPDSPGFFIVEGSPGSEELADEIEAYHYVWSETPRGKQKGVYRVDDDRIAAVEYANEEYVEGRSADFTRKIESTATKWGQRRSAR